MKRNSIFNEEEVKRYKKTVGEYEQTLEECEKKSSELRKQITELEAEMNKIKWPRNSAVLDNMRRHLGLIDYAEKINKAVVSGSKVMVSSEFHQGYEGVYIMNGDSYLKNEEADLIDPEWRKSIKDHKVISVDMSTIVWSEDHLELTAKVGNRRHSFLVKDIVGNINSGNRGICFVYDFKK